MESAPKTFRLEPSEEQAQAVDILHRLVTKIVTFQTGLGKTYTSLLAFERARKEASGFLGMIILTPKSAIRTWQVHLKDHTDYLVLDCLSHIPPEKYNNKPIPDVILCEHTCMLKAQEPISKMLEGNSVVVVIDEYHKFKNTESFLSKNLDALLMRARCTWALTATPLLNHLEDIFHLVNRLFPSALGNIHQFQRTYLERRLKRVGCAETWEVTGYKNLDRLARELKKYTIHAYREVDVEFFRMKAKPSAEEEMNYLMAAAGAVRGGSIRDFATRLYDLQYAADGVPLDSEEFKGVKESFLVEHVKRLTAAGNAVIIYSDLKRQIFKLRKTLSMENRSSRVQVITGETPALLRASIEKDFSSGDTLLISGAGGESLNLQASCHLIFYNVPFAVHKFIQAAGRIIRMNTVHKKLYVYFYEVEDTIDTYKLMYLFSNIERIRTIVGNSANLPSSAEVPSKQFIIQMRESLLWRTRAIRLARAKD